MLGLLRQVQGWVKIKGATDGTKIGNTGDRLKVDTDSSSDVGITQFLLVNAGQEYDLALNNARQIIVKTQDKVANIRVAFSANGTQTSGAGANKFITIPEGGSFQLSNINLTGKTIYFSSDKSNILLEVLEVI